jgi:hypothetical protein
MQLQEEDCRAGCSASAGEAGPGDDAAGGGDGGLTAFRFCPISVTTAKRALRPWAAGKYPISAQVIEK